MFKHLSTGFLSLSVIFSIVSIHFGYIAFVSALLFSSVGMFILWAEKAYHKPVQEKSEVQKIQDEIDLERSKSVLEELKHQIFMNKAKRDIKTSAASSKESKYIF